jgi:hypothetical protein
MRRAAKVDTTHAEIRDALREAGCSVFSCAAVGNGIPDLVCGYRGFTALVEAKTGARPVNERQSAFIHDWQGIVLVARTGEEAVSKFFTAWTQDRLQKAI